MEHNPLDNVPHTILPLNKKIGGVFYRFATIIAVDDTDSERLTIHTYGGKLFIANPELRKEFLQWYTDIHKATQCVGHITIPRHTFSVLGEW